MWSSYLSPLGHCNESLGFQAYTATSGTIVNLDDSNNVHIETIWSLCHRIRAQSHKSSDTTTTGYQSCPHKCIVNHKFMGSCNVLLINNSLEWLLGFGRGLDLVLSLYYRGHWHQLNGNMHRQSTREDTELLCPSGLAALQPGSSAKGAMLRTEKMRSIPPLRIPPWSSRETHVTG